VGGILIFNPPSSDAEMRQHRLEVAKILARSSLNECNSSTYPFFLFYGNQETIPSRSTRPIQASAAFFDDGGTGFANE
jgi:hypothetical protein